MQLASLPNCLLLTELREGFGNLILVFSFLGVFFPLRHDLISPSKWRDIRLNIQQKGVNRTNKCLPTPRQSGSAVSSLPRAPPLPSAHRPTIFLSLAPSFIPLTLLSLLSLSLSSSSSSSSSSSPPLAIALLPCLVCYYLLFVCLRPIVYGVACPTYNLWCYFSSFLRRCRSLGDLRF
ncbi:hypothetical protein BDV41DRAFT_428280 [Aspergillus transmontanensis]|uniref:Transmembrane protein n=1 Tax=Aspergillus transmontanensis TaxID=1034304 RepID=A0A5N6VM75_9EURO|nr:hypothetical protein BDV41DRAFT_428280 [Aspergillus transmontanensis]